MEIKHKVAEKLASSTEIVKELIITKMAESEINSRVELALKAIEKVTEIALPMK